ncbi:MAG: universal stress protein, partial [Paracoccaceae bacterium]|nr:universal stress protein [Paracoccaceae bacterium]
ASETALEGEPAEALLAHLEAGGHDLLVMGAYGHSRIRNLIIGSVTTQMLVGARLPVLLFR